MRPYEFQRLLDEYLSGARANRGVPRTLPEAALYGVLERFLNGVLSSAGPPGARAVPQGRAENDIGIPDFVIDAGGTLGYVEAKKPATDLGNLRSAHDRRQKSSFLNLPNLLYTNYRDFELYEEGELVGTASLGGLEVLDTRRPQEPGRPTSEALRNLLERFGSHRIAPPRSADGLASALARAGRLLHDAAQSALQRHTSALSSLRRDWQGILFGDEGDTTFADAYALTVAYGLLTARLGMDGVLTLDRAVDVLDREHPFLGAALRLLTLSPRAWDEVGWAVRVVEQVVDGVSLETFRRSRHPDDPLLYFYEDFLAAYDPHLRDRRGVYYTPASVVRFQVRAVADALERLGRPLLLAEHDVLALDPAAGTGTYLLGLLDETAARLQKVGYDAGMPAALRRASEHVSGFEILVGPYTVAHQRVATWLRERDVEAPSIGVHLADTLLPPGSLPQEQQQLNLFVQDLVEERRAADRVKRDGRLVVVLGNPPYDRERSRGRQDWLQGLMTSFTAPVRQEARVNLKNLADTYVYFFRWALWKLFEAPDLEHGPRVLSYITNRSYLHGDAFEGLRLRLRERFDELWIVDLGGESRGATPEPNVFDVRVGVAILVAVRHDVATPSRESATVRYARLRGTREDKELALKAPLGELAWTLVGRRGGESLLPELMRPWRRLPVLDRLMPMRQSGVQTKRDALVVGTTAHEVLERLAPLTDPDVPTMDRRELFRETRDRKLPTTVNLQYERVVPYGYRPLDRRYLYDERSFVDFPRPRLHELWHPGQRAFVTLPKGHGGGPAVVVQPHLPDLHAYRGSYGGHVFPLWHDREHTQPNLAEGLLEALADHFDAPLAPDAVFGAILGLLSAPRYTLLHRDELAQGFPRVPFPLDASLFAAVAAMGSDLLALHAGDREPQVRVRLEGRPGPLEPARWEDQRLKVGPDVWVAGVTPQAWDYHVSGYRVMERWIRDRQGRDLARDLDLVQDLLHVAAVVEETVRVEPRLDELLTQVLDGETFGWRALLPRELADVEEDLQRFPDLLTGMAAESGLWDDVHSEALDAADER